MPRQRPKIFYQLEIPAVSRGGGVRTIPYLTRQTGATSFMNGVTIFPPGASVPLHRHNCDEAVVILKGRAVAEIDGGEHPLGAGDATAIPEGVHHRFRNASENHELKILWTYASLDANRTIISTGETRQIDAELSTGRG
jgi:putative monooxygenase